MALIDFENLFLKTPIYERFTIEDSDLSNLFELFHYTKRLDFFCPFCKKNSTFEGNNRPSRYNNGTQCNSYSEIVAITNHSLRENCMKHYMGDDIKQVKFLCTRDNSHFTAFIFHYFERTLIKIGQFPSISELNQERIIKYRKVLSIEQYKELNRGIGLTSHGVGIGSFVYLRRIFENLISDAIQHSVDNSELDLKDFDGLRMNEKIKLLKEYVPDFLYENREIYGVLSKGIHELSEEECLEFFPVLQVGIELILDEKYEEALKEEKKQNVSKELNKLKTLVNKK